MQDFFKKIRSWCILDEEEKKELYGLLLPIGFFLAIFLVSGIRYHTPIKQIILNFCNVFFWAFVLYTVCIIHSLFKEGGPSRIICTITVISLVLSIPYIPKLFKYETTQIGGFYEATSYTEKYYVLMSRENETHSNRKVYRLPAEIERREDYLYTSDEYEDYYGQIHGGNEIYDSNYHINYLYFSNGGYLYFKYDEAYDYPMYTAVYPNKEAKVTDYKGDVYYITLTKDIVK